MKITKREITEMISKAVQDTYKQKQITLKEDNSTFKISTEIDKNIEGLQSIVKNLVAKSVEGDPESIKLITAINASIKTFMDALVKKTRASQRPPIPSMDGFVSDMPPRP